MASSDQSNATIAPATSHWTAAIDRLDRSIADATEADDVYRLIVDEAMALSGAEAGSLVLLEEGGEWLRTVVAHGYDDEVLATFQRFRADADVPLAEAVRTARPLLLGDPAGYDDRYDDFRTAAVAAGRSGALCVPLRIADRVIGAVGLSFGPGRGSPAVDDLDAWAELGERCALGLTRVLVPEDPARLREMLHAARSRLAFVSAAGRELSRSLDRDSVLTTLTRLVVPRFADWASVLLPEGDELVAATLVHREQADDASENRAGRFRLPVDGTTPSSRAFHGTDPVRVVGVDDEVRARMAAYPELASLLGRTTSRLVVPLVVGDRTVGLLTLGDCGGRGLLDDDQAVMTELAQRVGTALTNAGRFEAEHDMVELLQRAVLPQGLPQVQGLDLAARYLPASVGSVVGGDWYDAFPLRDGRVALCVGDCAGNGVAAAACMAQLRNALRVYALDEPDPASVLTRLNRFAAETGVTGFTTVLFLAMDPARSEAEWSSAGHLPILLRRDGEAIWWQTEHGVPIGVTEGCRYDASTAALLPGDQLVLFTDGLVERRGEELNVGLARLATGIAAAETDDAESLADELMVAAEPHRNDDVCLLVVCRGTPRPLQPPLIGTSLPG